jgi:hypothetical protein
MFGTIAGSGTAYNGASSGAKLQTGNSYSYSFTLTTQTVAPGSYVLLKSQETNLTLSNTSGRARLLDPLGNTVSETDAYDKADEGIAWSLIDGRWQWTGMVTPATANVALSPLLSTANSKSPKLSATPKTAAAPKVKAATTPKAATSKNTKTGAAAANQKDTSDGEDTSRGHPYIIAGVGGLAVLYAAYEYRQDFGNRIYQLRRNRAARRAASASSAGQ